MLVIAVLPLSSFPASPWSCGSIQTIAATKVCARIDFLCCVVGDANNDACSSTMPKYSAMIFAFFLHMHWGGWLHVDLHRRVFHLLLSVSSGPELLMPAAAAVCRPHRPHFFILTCKHFIWTDLFEPTLSAYQGRGAEAATTSMGCLSL